MRKSAAFQLSRRRPPVIAGVGGITTRASIGNLRAAERAGADAVSVVAPSFISITQEELYRHFRAVAEARRTVSDEKPVWPVLQWYAYEGGRFPTPTEMRCMAFLAVAAGAKGLTWYSFYHGYKTDAAHWPDMQAIGRELRGVEDVVLAPEAQIRLETDPAEPPVEMLIKRGATGLHVVLVNYSDQPLQGLRLSFPVDVTSARDRLSGETYPLTGNTLHLDLEAYQPMVLDVAVDP
jgi:hypothetical protein